MATRKSFSTIAKKETPSNLGTAHGLLQLVLFEALLSGRLGRRGMGVSRPDGPTYSVHLAQPGESPP
jgi:hypothetical protein